MRRGELCGLRWSDVDLVERTATIRTQLVMAGKEIVENSAKTEAGDPRGCSLRPSRRCADGVADTAGRASARNGPMPTRTAGRVFTYEDGTQLRPGYPSSALKTLLAKSRSSPAEVPRPASPVRVDPPRVRCAAGAGVKDDGALDYRRSPRTCTGIWSRAPRTASLMPRRRGLSLERRTPPRADGAVVCSQLCSRRVLTGSIFEHEKGPDRVSPGQGLNLLRGR